MLIFIFAVFILFISAIFIHYTLPFVLIFILDLFFYLNTAVV